MTLRAMSPSSNRSRFLQKAVASHAGSSMASPLNQRNKLLHQLAFLADRVKGLQQQRAQQPLGWNRRPRVAGIKLGKRPRQLGQRRIGNLDVFLAEWPNACFRSPSVAG
jgi:hypothetical protein